MHNLKKILLMHKIPGLWYQHMHLINALYYCIVKNVLLHLQLFAYHCAYCSFLVCYYRLLYIDRDILSIYRSRHMHVLFYTIIINDRSIPAGRSTSVYLSYKYALRRIKYNKYIDILLYDPTGIRDPGIPGIPFAMDRILYVVRRRNPTTKGVLIIHPCLLHTNPGSIHYIFKGVGLFIHP